MSPMVDAKVAAVRRVARKSHICGEYRTGCTRRIMPGDVYLQVKLYPGHDAVSVGAPFRYAACAHCSCRGSHGHLLEPVPYSQCARDGLL